MLRERPESVNKLGGGNAPLRNPRILILGATGFLGGAISSRLQESGIQHEQSSLSLGADLREYKQARELFERVRPSVIFNCAAYVGGIQFGYEHPVQIFNDNLLMTVYIYRAAQAFAVSRIINPISNCIYPSKATVFREDEVWDGPLNESVLVYGMTRKMHWIGAWAYHQEAGLDTINLVLPNLYGPGDHFDPIRSHALGALIAKIVKAKLDSEPKVTIWGTGAPIREWMFIDDAVDAMMAAMHTGATTELINVGTESGVSILELAELIKREVGYEGLLGVDPSRPDGALHKTLDGSRARQLLNWKPTHALEEGIRRTVAWYVSNQNSRDLLHKAL